MAPVAAENLEKAGETREERSKRLKSKHAKERSAENRSTPSSRLLDALEEKMSDGVHLLWFILKRMDKWGTRTDETQLDPAVFAEWNSKKDLDNMQAILNLLSKGDRQGITTLCAPAKPNPVAEGWRRDRKRRRLFQRAASPEPAGSRDTTAQVSPRTLPGALPGARSRTPPTPAGSQSGATYSTRGWPAQGASDDEFAALNNTRDQYDWSERPSKETVAQRVAALAALAAPEAPVAALEAQKGRLTYDDDGLDVMPVDSAGPASKVPAPALAAPEAPVAAPEVPAPAPALWPLAQATARKLACLSEMLGMIHSANGVKAGPPARPHLYTATNPGAGGAAAAPPVRVKVEVINLCSDSD